MKKGHYSGAVNKLGITFKEERREENRNCKGLTKRHSPKKIDQNVFLQDTVYLEK